MENQLEIVKVKSKEEYAWTVILRYKVFCIEQGFDPNFDIDKREDESIYFLALDNKKPIGTARYRLIDGAAKIEAVVILKDFREKGYASRLLDFMHKHLKNIGVKNVYLNSMIEAEPFYLKIGYTRSGSMFKTPSGAPHYKMILEL